MVFRTVRELCGEICKEMPKCMSFDNIELICSIKTTETDIHTLWPCTCTGNAGNVFATNRLQRKPIVSDPGMHHGTCVTHVPWCMSGSLTRDGEGNVTNIPGACATRNMRLWSQSTLFRWSLGNMNLLWIAFIFSNTYVLYSRYRSPNWNLEVKVAATSHVDQYNHTTRHKTSVPIMR